jgi:long-chain acyl-CoA synthetase
VREYSIPAPAEIPASASLDDVVFRRAAADPGLVILRRRAGAGSWRDVTAAGFCAEVAGLARGLVAAGIEPGDRVALMSHTRYEWTLIDYACWAAGAVTVPVYETSSAEEVEWIVRDSAARAAFAETAGHQKMISGVRGRLPRLERLWMIGELDPLASAGAQVSDDELERRRAGRGAADLATIIYTSGTTGRPKGCQLTHGNLLADVRSAIAALPEIFETPGCSTLLFLPLAHAFARIIQIGILEAGAVLGHWPDFATLPDGLAEFRPTFVLAVPRVFEKAFQNARQRASSSPAGRRIFAHAEKTAIEWSNAIGAAAAGGPGPALRLRHALFGRLVYARLQEAFGGEVRYAVCGGAPLGERLGHFFRGAGITVLEGYGLTEASGAVTVNRPGRGKIGTVGQPLPGTAVRIVGNGEIQVKCPGVFAGYWRDDAATAEVDGGDGWLRTGDIGELDEEGFLKVTGREKDLIITAGGTNVAPAVLENRIRAHPLVSQVIVVGDERPYVACLVTLDAEALQAWNRQHGRPAGASAGDLASDAQLIAEIQRVVDDANKAVSRAESIRRFAILATDFTEALGQLTPSDKVRRHVVARDFAAEIEALYNQPPAGG